MQGIFNILAKSVMDMCPSPISRKAMNILVFVLKKLHPCFFTPGVNPKALYKPIFTSAVFTEYSSGNYKIVN